jgi:hypothetical protein
MSWSGDSVSDFTNDKNPPSTWQGFQNLCIDVFPIIQSEFGIERIGYVRSWASTGYGKNGNKQWGVDVFDKFSNTIMQCKHVTEFKKRDLESELVKLAGYPHPISVHIFVTTLNETDVNVQDYIVKHNKNIGFNVSERWPMAVVPSKRMPMLIEMNWRNLKSFLIKDVLVAGKWRLLRYDSRYPDLNGCDIRLLEGAVCSRYSYLASGIGGKRADVLEAVRRMTASLDFHGISSIGRDESINTSVVDGMQKFVKEFDQAMEHASRFERAIDSAYSLDGHTKQIALETLNKIAPYSQRIDSIKYLWRLSEAVSELVETLDDADYFYHRDDDVDIGYGNFVPMPRETERCYDFYEDGFESYRPQLSRVDSMNRANFIVQELLNLCEYKFLVPAGYRA